MNVNDRVINGRVNCPRLDYGRICHFRWGQGHCRSLRQVAGPVKAVAKTSGRVLAKDPLAGMTLDEKIVQKRHVFHIVDGS